MTQTQTTAVFSEQLRVPSSRSAVLEFPYERQKFLITEPNHHWWIQSVKQLETLVRLEVGWDGYKGEPVSLENANFALTALQTICGSDDPAPQIVPGTSGDLQIEWHTHGVDIELHIMAPNNVHAWIANEDTGPDGKEFPLTIDFTEVVRQIKKMTEYSSDRATTA